MVVSSLVIIVVVLKLNLSIQYFNVGAATLLSALIASIMLHDDYREIIAYKRSAPFLFFALAGAITAVLFFLAV